MLTKRDKTKYFIIEKAAPLFNKKGYAGTSMQDIMESTGLAKGCIYGNFENKDEIAALAFDYSYEKMKSEIRLKISGEKSPKNKLLAILNFYKDYSIISTIDGGCVLLNTAVDADDAYPFLKKKARQALVELLGILKAYFAAGITAREFKKSIIPEKEAELFFALVEGGIMMAKVMDDHHVLNRILDNLKEHIDRNLST